MGKLHLTLVVRDYDQFTPLASGDIVPADLDLNLERDTLRG